MLRVDPATRHVTRVGGGSLYEHVRAPDDLRRPGRRARRRFPPQGEGATAGASVPAWSAGQGEELESDVVGVAEREPRAVRGVDDAAVLDAEFVEPLLPVLELTAACAVERDVIEPGPVLLERL